MNRLAFDSLSALALAITALLGAYIPAFLAKRDRLAGGSGRSLAYVLGNMLSAGVMVSAGFCHLLGEALRAMPQIRFPLATFLCGTGYMLTLVADKVVASATGGHSGCGHAHSLGAKQGPAADSCCAVEVLAGVDIMERGDGKYSGSEGEHPMEVEACSLLGRAHSPKGRLGSSPLPSPLQRPAARRGGRAASSSGDHEHISSEGAHERLAAAAAANGGADGYPHSLSNQGSKEAAADGWGGVGGSAAAGAAAAGWRRGSRQHSTESLVFELEPPEAPAPLVHGGSGSGNGLLAAPPAGAAGGMGRSVSFLTAMLMGVALCFHSLLEGAAMGAQPTISNSLHIFIAIVSHKGLAAYALGSSIVDSEASMRRFWSVVLPFTFASPIGIFIGYIASDVAKGLGAACISALASGTFLYVAYMEVIPKELRDPSNMPLKLAALLTGFCLMSLLAVWA